MQPRPTPCFDLPTQSLGHTVGLILAPPPDDDLAPIVGHFRVTEVLGRGGHGLVVKAVDPKLRRTVALKVLSAEAAARPEARKRFLREARAAAAVRSEHVVAIHAVEDGPRPFLVLEYLPGGSLQQRFEQTGRFSPADIVRVGAQVARGLAAAHALGIVHRDVKPANVFLDAGPGLTAKVGDFGLVWVPDDPALSRDGAVVGTPYYMSPEQARGESLDHRSDLFSLGTVLYVLATGMMPFAAPTSAGVVHRVAFYVPPAADEVVPDVPPWLGAVIARLHAPDPDNRFQSAAELAAVLENCGRQLARGGSVADLRLPPRRARKRRWPRIAAAVGLACAALMTADPFRTPATHQPPPVEATLPVAPAPREVVRDPNRFTNPFGMTFARVPKGTARLGGTGGNAGRDGTTFEADFFLGVTEVTHAEWDRVMGPGHNPSFYSRDGGHQHDVTALTNDEIARLPVDSLSWDDCQEFLARLNTLDRDPAWVYRLPSVREWEYACRGGPDVSRSAAGFDFYAGEPTLTLVPDRANIQGGPNRPVPVASYQPNRLGLYDMHGNVCEYAADYIGEGKLFRPLLGGWWADDASQCQANWCGMLQATVPYRGAGLRVARVPAN